MLPPIGIVDVTIAEVSSRASRPLPTTRLARRRRASHGWFVGVGLTILVNLLVVLGLSQASSIVHETIEPPQRVRNIHRAETPPLASEPPPVTRTSSAPQTTLPTVTLPALALSDLPTNNQLTLPAFAPTDMPMSLPTSVPAFVAIASGAPEFGGDGIAISEQALTFDEPPVMIAALDLRRYYPRQAVARDIEGETVIRLVLDANGVITESSILSSTPEGVFEDAALRMAKQFRFRPAQRGGQNVPAIFTQTISWHLD
jgi:TonB family protein